MKFINGLTFLTKAEQTEVLTFAEMQLGDDEPLYKEKIIAKVEEIVKRVEC